MPLVAWILPGASLSDGDEGTGGGRGGAAYGIFPSCANVGTFCCGKDFQPSLTLLASKWPTGILHQSLAVQNSWWGVGQNCRLGFLDSGAWPSQQLKRGPDRSLWYSLPFRCPTLCMKFAGLLGRHRVWPSSSSSMWSMVLFSL
uniref:Uncharacterized protein n=1 Tax=Sphaerodactylus townsendi TaxID=933632 RepID=A0ACB8EG71_9SAUR